MDLSKFKVSDWLKVAGGLLFFIAGFLAWWELDLGFVSGSNNAFDYFFTGIVPWLIFTAIAVLTFLTAAGIWKLPETFPAPVVFLAGAALGTLLVIIRFFSDGEDGVSLDRAIGLYLAIIGAIVVLVGAFLAFQESGGKIGELAQSFQKKPATRGPDDAPPPPPPPAV